MVGFFLVAQLAYITAFAPSARRSPLRRRSALAVPYLAALATGVHPLAVVGGIVFLASDAMIALGEFTTWFAPPAPASG